MIYYILLTIILTISIVTFIFINYVSRKYKNVKLKNDISGFEVSKKILDYNNKDIYIVEKKNSVINIYDYNNKVIRLNSDTYYKSNIVSVVEGAFVTNYAIEKDNTIIKLNRIFSSIIDSCSIISIIITIIGIIFSNELLKIGTLLLLFIFIIEIISLLNDFKNSVNTINILKKLKIINKNEINKVLSFLSIYRFKNLSYIIVSLINLKDNIF